SLPVPGYSLLLHVAEGLILLSNPNRILFLLIKSHKNNKSPASYCSMLVKLEKGSLISFQRHIL
ncbi:MAG TPA: hypothetical protein VGC08_15830, partial [Pedobacter sp.]